LQVVLDKADVPSFDATRYFPALRLADEVLAARAITDRRIHLISDFQSSAMRDFDATWRLSPGVDFVAENIVQDGRRNLTVTGVKLPPLQGEQLSGDLLVRVRSTGTLRENKTELSLNLNGEEHFRDVVELGEQSETLVTVPLNLSGEGLYQGSISIADDDFLPDNTFYFTLDVPGKIPVLVVNGGSASQWYEDASHWFTLALAGHAQSPFAVTSIEQQAFNAAMLSDYRIVVLLNLAPLSQLQVEALENFVEGGGSLLLAPAGRSQPEAFNRQL